MKLKCCPERARKSGIKIRREGKKLDKEENDGQLGWVMEAAAYKKKTGKKDRTTAWQSWVNLQSVIK